MRDFILLILLLFLLANCNDTYLDDLSGDCEIRGSVFFSDTLQGTGQKYPIAGTFVKIKFEKESSTLNFIFGTKSDSLGNFLFTNLSKTRAYILEIETTINGINYKKDTVLKLEHSISYLELIIYPNLQDRNLLVITATDISGGRLSKLNVCLFNSSLLAAQNLCDGNDTTIITDFNGRAFISGLSSRMYYLNARDSVGVVDIRAKDSIDISSNSGPYFKTLILQ